MLCSFLHLTTDSRIIDHRRPKDHDSRVDRRPPKPRPGGRR
jgi:hypothetical protein